MATKPPETTGGPQEERTPNPPPTLRLAPNTAPLRRPTPTAPLTGALQPTPTAPLTGSLRRFTGPLTAPLEQWPDWPDVLQLAGSPVVAIDLVSGVIDGGPDSLGQDELAVLRVLAQRQLQSKHANRALIHYAAFDGQGDPSRVDRAIAALRDRLHHVVESGPGVWHLWADPE